MSRTVSIVFLLLLLTGSAAAQDVTIELAPVEHPLTAGVLVATATVTNHLGTDLTNVRVLARLAFGRTILAGGSDDTWSCRDAGTLQSVQCVAAVLPAGKSVPLTFYIDALYGRFRLHAWVDDPREGEYPVVSTRDAWFPYDLHVTHDGDSGEGSLRRTIVLANEDCAGVRLPCRIVFDGTEPMTIRPRTALPVLWGSDLAVDGGARVTLDGSQVDGGSGLEITGAFSVITVRALTIRSFPWDGVHIDGSNTSMATVEDCKIEANGSRGISATSPVSILRNRIRRQGRSGVFITGDSPTIEGNEIDGNGASGVFISGNYAKVVRNRITANEHFGVAVPRTVLQITITENSIAGNRISGIDRGLDGSDGDRYDDHDWNHAYIPPPRLDDAHYDAASNTTTIRGRYFNELEHFGYTWTIEVFSNPLAESQGQTFLGRTGAANGEFSLPNGEFSLVVPGDLRGRFITATGQRGLNLGWSGAFWWTSEFAPVIEVR